MLRLIAARLAQSIVLLLLISIVVFALLRLAPGDPGVQLYGADATAQDLAQIRQVWGLDDPIHIQYLRWLSNAIGGDLGRSYIDGRPALAVIAERVPATLLLSSTALLFAILTGIPLGLLAATHRSSLLDRIVTLLATTMYSIPPFWLGILLILVVSLKLNWLPSGSMFTAAGEPGVLDLLRHLTLPALTLALRDVGRFARVSRASIIEELGRDYLRTAAAKGMSRGIIATRHTLRNALLPIITLIGLSVPALLSGALVVEMVFAWPGMGRLAIESALQRNYPVVLGEVLVVAVLAILGSLLADIAYSVADPRIGKANGL
ncbi:MAG: ABC transporter permease [Chloroflexota bacterium]|jgi:peptide/nickel transport system permease protein